MPKISIVVAIGKNREIGLKNDLLWYIPDDLRHFKQITMGHPVIMGRKTFESIVSRLKKPLPGRTNIVITRDPTWQFDGVTVTHSLEEALAEAKKVDSEEIFIGGGADTWKQAFPQVDRLYLTLIEDTKPADTFLPPYDQFTKKISEEEHEYKGLRYRWVTLEK